LGHAGLEVVAGGEESASKRGLVQAVFLVLEPAL
jgi:hypothetical protein